MARRLLLLILLPLLLSPLPSAAAEAPREPCQRPSPRAHLFLCDWDADGVPEEWYFTHVGPLGANATSEGNRSAGEAWTFNRAEAPGQLVVYADAYRWTNGSHNHTFVALGALTHRTGMLGTEAAQATLACRGAGHAGQCAEAWMDARVVLSRLGRSEAVTLARDASGTWACAFGSVTLGCARLLP